MTLTLAPETEVRLRAVATQRNIAPEALVDAAIDALLRQELNAADAEQARLQDLFEDLQAEALNRNPLPAEGRPQHATPEEIAFGEIITEKFRRQGFNL